MFVIGNPVQAVIVWELCATEVSKCFFIKISKANALQLQSL